MNKSAQHLENVKSLDALTRRELARAIRDAVIAENDAIKQYETVVDSTNDSKTKEVLQSIANEEKVHIGELQQLLKMLSPNEQEFLNEGSKEVEESDMKNKSAGHMNANEPAPGETQHDIETKGKKAKVSLSGDKIEPRKTGPWDTEGSPENVGETYKDLATKEAYWIGFQQRCAAHGTNPNQVFEATKKAMENAMASPSAVVFEESEIPVKECRKKKNERSEGADKSDTNTVRRETQGKKEESPDILTSAIKGNHLERSKG